MSAPAVIVSGMIAATPGQGGAAWAILQYLLGLRRLGCRVHFVEPIDTPEVPDASASYCRAVMGRFGLDGSWALVPVDGGEPAGMTRPALRKAATETDVLLNVSGMLSDPDVLDPVPVRAFLDLDPGFVQLWHQEGDADMGFGAHTHFVSVADAIGSPGCPIPDCGLSWIPTLPPVVLEQWPAADRLETEAATTVGHWRSYGSIHHEGLHFGQRAHSLRTIMDLPRRTGTPLALALGIHPDETSDLAALEENGWTLVDPDEVARLPDDYARFVRGSWAELGVAKLGYVVSDSGWFSDRSACYLASGRPVVAQDTGFGRRLPVSAGLFAFSSADEAAVGLEEIARDYERHRAGARAVAEEHLDSDRVLGSLLERLTR